ncbi:unnamed protein product [Dicrocoelium dendriticum]|nr:unnamed protein product [Dicrocoelium dendriticum]
MQNPPKSLAKHNNDRSTVHQSHRIRRWAVFQNYFKTFPAIIRVTEIIFMLTLFGISCVEKKFLATGGSWMVITVVLACLSSLCFLLFHWFLLHRFVAAPWTLIEFLVAVTICLLIFSSGVLSAAYSHIGSVMIAQTVLLFLALAVYMVNALITFKILMAGRYYE